MKVGRNQPCPCGSGKRHKKCCLGKEKVSSDLLYRRLGEVHDRLAHRLMRYGLKVFGEDALGVALDEFMAWPEDGIGDEDLADHQPLFYPWFIFNWEYEADPDFPQLNGPEGTTIAELYVVQKASLLNHLEAQIIEATARQPFSFYEIRETQPGRGYRLKDILRGTVSDVTEKKGSERTRQGDILFARVAQIGSITMLVGCGTVLIPPKMKPELIRFRKWLQESEDPITSHSLYEYDLEIRELYFNIFYSLMEPPELQNTDGDTTTPDSDQEKLVQMPEVREQMNKMLFTHWEKWIDEKIPALGHRTPRQAVKDPDGRESVEALLLDARRHMGATEQMRDAGSAAIAEARRRLGLDKPASGRAVKADGRKNVERIADVKRLVEAFGRSSLGPEYTDLALKLCDKVGRMRKLSIQRGRIEIWAAAIVHVIARLNFLFDPQNEVYITTDDLNVFFGTKKTTVSNKAGMILKAANIFPGDPDFSSAEIANMFRLYETEDGLLIPASILDEIGIRENEKVTQPGKTSHPTDRKTKRRPEPQPAKPVGDLKKKDVVDRQLKLFDDE